MKNTPSCTHSLFRASSALLLGLVALASASISHLALAVPYAEQGDAGDLPGSAQIVNGPALTPLTAITGMLTLTAGISEGDMYAIFINSPATFSATTTGFAPGVNGFDTQLFLFNAAGLGVYTNDDDPTTGAAQSTLPAGNALLTSLPAGVYYLLITGSGRFPIDSLSQLIFPNFTDGTTDPTGVYGRNSGSGAVSDFSGNSNEGGKYSIALAGAQFIPVPEPAVFTLGLTGMLGMLVGRRFFNSRKS